MTLFGILNVSRHSTEVDAMLKKLPAKVANKKSCSGKWNKSRRAGRPLDLLARVDIQPAQPASHW